ncbi:hypothetical protein KJ865_14900 [Myxococcota bacterium]|nr:hypothetical protein [Myxococcota bacterium]
MIVTLLLISCTKTGPVKTGASQIIDSYRQAVLNDQPKKAYDLLDAETQKKVPYTWFAAQWKTNRKEMLYQARSIKGKDPRVTVRYSGKNGTRITMVTEKGKWKVEEAPGLLPSPESPEKLLGLMVKAIDTLDLALYISLLSPRYRDTIIATLKKKMAELEKARLKIPANKNDAVEQVTIPLDSYGNVQLVLKKYGTGWKVESWEIRKSYRYR